MFRSFSKHPAVLLTTGLAAGAIIGGACIAMAEQVHMQNALRSLENARAQLADAVADKGGHRRFGCTALVHVWSVSARGQHDGFAPRTVNSGDCLDLLLGSVLVVETLEDQDRRQDTRQVFLDIPASKLRTQPHAGPRTKQRIDALAVIPRQPGPEIALFVKGLDPSNVLDGQILYEHVRRFQNQSRALTDP